MPVIWDRAMQLGTAPGTGNVTLSSTPTQFRALLATIGNTVIFDYMIEGLDASSQRTALWETGVGYMNGSNQLIRTSGATVTDGSSGPGVLVNFTGTTTQVRVMNSHTAAAIRRAILDAARIGTVDVLFPSSNIVTVNLSTGVTKKRADISANTAITLAGITDGGEASLQLKNTSGSAVTLTWDSGMVVVGQPLPLLLAPGKTLRVSFDASSTTLASVTVGWTVQQ